MAARTSPIRILEGAKRVKLAGIHDGSNVGLFCRNSSSSKQTPDTSDEGQKIKTKKWNLTKNAVPYIAGAVALPIAIPLALCTAGFTSAGIVAGSFAAGMMSWAPGSLVAVCQSVGAAGFGAAGNIAAGSVGVGVIAVSKNKLKQLRERKEERTIKNFQNKSKS